MADRLLQEFQSLDPREQVVLLDRFVTVVPQDDEHVSPEWHAELCRRIDDVESDEVQFISSEKVIGTA